MDLLPRGRAAVSRGRLSRRVARLEAAAPPPEPTRHVDLSRLTPADRDRLRAILEAQPAGGRWDLSGLPDDDLEFLERVYRQEEGP